MKEFSGQSKCFNHCYRNLLAGASWRPLSHKEHSEWHCHKITELERVVPHNVVLRRKCYLFILGLPSSPSPKSRSKTLGVWCFSIVSTPLFTVQMSFSEDLFFTANHLLLGSNEYSKSHLLALYRKRKITTSESSPGVRWFTSKWLDFRDPPPLSPMYKHLIAF